MEGLMSLSIPRAKSLLPTFLVNTRPGPVTFLEPQPGNKRSGIRTILSLMYIKAAILITKEGKYLLVKESHAYQGRSWNWPQGKATGTETPEETALREGKEETGLDLRIERKLAVLTDTFPDTKELHVFLATPRTETLVLPPDEILDAQWLSREEIETREDELVGKWILDTIKQL